MQEFFFTLLLVDTWAEFAWVIFGLSAQAVFMCRFLVQWIASERAKKSYVPVAFWYLSIIGAASLLIYGVYRQDIVIIFGQAFGFIVYSRNLILIHRDKGAADTPSPNSGG